jgi:hypothetical protein
VVVVVLAVDGEGPVATNRTEGARGGSVEYLS